MSGVGVAFSEWVGGVLWCFVLWCLSLGLLLYLCCFGWVLWVLFGMFLFGGVCKLVLCWVGCLV